MAIAPLPSVSADTTPARPKRRRFLSFSLAGLFVFTSLCAAGFGAWVWPYRDESEYPGPEITEKDGKRVRLYEKLGPRDNPHHREVRTMRRVLFGEAVRHGKSQIYDSHRNLLREEHWRMGSQVGLYSVWNEEGKLMEQASPNDGPIDGRWVAEHWEGSPPRQRDETEYLNGLPAGHWKHFRHGLLVAEEEFEDGVLRVETVFLHDSQGRIASCTQRVRDAEHKTCLETRWLGPRERKMEETHHRTVRYQPINYDLPRVKRGTRKIPPTEIDEKQGPSSGWHDDGRLRREGSWLEGRPDGDWRFWDEQGRVERVLEFERGVLVRADGRAIDDFTARFRFFGAAADYARRTTRASQFQVLVSTDFNSVPLSDIVDWLKKQVSATPLDWVFFKGNLLTLEVELRRDVLKASGIDEQTTFSLRARDIPLGAALCMLFEPHGLIAVDRYEKLWITTADDEWARREPTGADSLDPPPKIAEALATPTVLEFIDTPLKDVANYFSDLHGIPVRISESLTKQIRQGNECPVTLNSKDCSLRSALGRILEPHGLTCEMKDGVILICPAKPPVACGSNNDKPDAQAKER